MRILHLSDLHYRSNARDNARANEAVAAALDQWRMGDAVAVTGDVTDDGKPAQYAQALVGLRPLRERAPLFMVVPGNHDYGRLGNFYQPAARRRFVGFARDLGVNFGEVRNHDCPNSTYPHGAPDVALVAVDSCARTRTPFDFARGRVGPWQRWRLRLRLDRLRAEGFRPVVLLHHHPFVDDWAMRLEDAAAFRDAVAGRAALVLYGHTHAAEDRQWPGPESGAPAQTLFRAASAACNRGAEALRVHVVAR